jgi:hypothetical protein
MDKQTRNKHDEFNLIPQFQSWYVAVNLDPCLYHRYTEFYHPCPPSHIACLRLPMLLGGYTEYSAHVMHLLHPVC